MKQAQMMIGIFNTHETNAPFAGASVCQGCIRACVRIRIVHAKAL